jgi:hypothetical protein
MSVEKQANRVKIEDLIDGAHMAAASGFINMPCEAAVISL